MKKRISIIIFIVVIIIILFMGLMNLKDNKAQESLTLNNTTKSNIRSKLKPISKENAIKILKAQYGENISTKENNIVSEGDYYIVEVYADLENSEENEHEHVQSLGKHKIDMYTGEIMDVK